MHHGGCRVWNQQVYVFDPLDYKYVKVWMESKDILTSLNTIPKDATISKNLQVVAEIKVLAGMFFYIQIMLISI